MENFAVLFEQGCGKSKVIVDTAAYLFSYGRIDTVVIIAPNGVHRKWLNEDFPFSCPDYVPYVGAIWDSTNKVAKEECEALMSPSVTGLRVLCMNVEAFSHKTGLEFLKRFLNATEAMLVVDESSRIKNPDAIRTKNLCKLSDRAKYKRILTGTPVSNSPFDYYAQFMFLDPQIFGCSYYAFKAEYAELIEKDSQLMRAIMAKSKARFTPQIVSKDDSGKPKYRNLDKLKEMIAPYSMRVTKDEVLPELPKKIYEKRFYELEPAHRKMYDQLVSKMKLELEDSKVTILHKMTLYLRLQQLACGYITGDDGKTIQLYKEPTHNPRIKLLLETLEDTDGQVIIWARFKEDIRQIAAVLGSDAVTYYGDTKDREESLRAFRAGEKRFFVGNAVVGGIGLNLVNSACVIYYSNTFSYEDRKQSEDRCHRIGQEHDSVLYTDLEAVETVDTKIIGALHSKEDLAMYMADLGAWAA